MNIGPSSIADLAGGREHHLSSTGTKRGNTTQFRPARILLGSMTRPAAAK